MDLELVPLEGEDDHQRLLSPEERERMILRIKPIQPEALQHFDPTQRKEIQTFLYRLIAVSEQLHHDMEDTAHKDQLKEHMNKLHTIRKALFDKASPAVQEFTQLVDLSAVEPWLEWEVMMNSLRREMQKAYFATKNTTGQAAALDNPFLMQVDDLRDDALMDLKKKGRLTPHEIEEVIFYFSLEDLVKFLIQSRKVITGQFWERDYDL